MASTVWKGHLTFGLVSIPVRLFKAARAERISFHQLGRTQAASRGAKGSGSSKVEKSDRAEEAEEKSRQLARVHHQLVADGEKVAPNEVVKGYEYEKDRYVVIDDEDLKKIAPKTGTEMQIQEFVKLSEIDPVYFDASYYVAPEEAGGKAYSLLFATMKDSGYVALAEVAMHRRERLVGIRPGEKGLIAHTLFHAEEVRRDLEFKADTHAVNDKELHMAKQLVNSLLEDFDAKKFKDQYRAKVQALIDAKLAGKEVEEAPAAKKGAEVVDIMAALQNSLKALKKPATAAAGSKRKRASGS